MAIERIVPGTLEWDAFYANHIVRYKFASEIVAYKTSFNILDIACGVGYGSRLLADKGNVKITGADISVQALKIASKNFDHPLITFIKDDCSTMKESRQYGPFNSIISFETLEHLKNPEVFLANIRENLETEGNLIISTPNALISSPGGITDWEFHEKEYTPVQFYQLLNNAGFKEIEIYGQEFTESGLLRQQLRHELYGIQSNPFLRIGRWIQKTFRKRRFGAILPEKESDFSILKYPVPTLEKMNAKGPFVLLAVARK